MEILGLFDKECNYLNKTIERRENIHDENNVIPAGEYILVSIIYIKKNNKFLIQRTSEIKGHKLTSTGGHVELHETPLTTIIRECEEEIGLKLEPSEIKVLKKIIVPKRPVIFCTYEVEKDVDIENLKLQKSEVESVVWLTKDEIYNLIDQNEFTYSHSILFKELYK